MKISIPILIVVSLATHVHWSHAVDENGNGLNDIWETLFDAEALVSSEDTDGDGFTNLDESTAGTDPFDAASYLDLSLEIGDDDTGQLTWEGLAGKRYVLRRSLDLNPSLWEAFAGPILGEGAEMTKALSLTNLSRQFYQLNVGDTDSDSDTFSDWEEMALGFDPLQTHTDREDALDSARIAAELNGTSTLTVAVYDGHPA